MTAPRAAGTRRREEPGGGRNRVWLCRAGLVEAGRLMFMQIRTLGKYWTAGLCYRECGWWVLNSLNWICPGAHLRETKQAPTLRPVLIQDLCLSFRRENADCCWCYHPACRTVILWGDSSTPDTGKKSKQNPFFFLKEGIIIQPVKSAVTPGPIITSPRLAVSAHVSVHRLLSQRGDMGNCKYIPQS